MTSSAMRGSTPVSESPYAEEAASLIVNGPGFSTTTPGQEASTGKPLVAAQPLLSAMR